MKHPYPLLSDGFKRAMFAFAILASLLTLSLATYAQAPVKNKTFKKIPPGQAKKLERQGKPVIHEQRERFNEDGTIEYLDWYAVEDSTAKGDSTYQVAAITAIVDQTGCRRKTVWQTPQYKIRVLVLGDGFTDSTKFFIDAINSINYQLAEPVVVPFKNYFRFDAKYGPSNQSGITNAIACYTGGVLMPITNVDTRYKVVASYGGLCRLFSVTNSQQVYADATADGIVYDYVLVISNTSFYGGSGGQYPVASTNAQSGEIMRHEFCGHRVGGMGDEYTGPYCQGGMYGNVATDSVSAVLKFGSYNLFTRPYKGANYSMTCYWKGFQYCKMKTLGTGFCAVCSTAVVNKIKYLAGLFDPAPTPPTVTISPAAATINKGQALVLYASGADAYVWQPGNIVGANVSFFPQVTTTYTVTGTRNGLSASKTAVVTVIQPSVIDTCVGTKVTLEVRYTLLGPYVKWVLTKEAGCTNYKFERSTYNAVTKVWSDYSLITTTALYSGSMGGFSKSTQNKIRVTCVEKGCSKVYQLNIP